MHATHALGLSPLHPSTLLTITPHTRDASASLGPSQHTSSQSMLPSLRRLTSIHLCTAKLPLAPAAIASPFGLLNQTPSRHLSSSIPVMSAPYQVIATKDAPSAIGPYSQAVVHNGVAYLSGCIPLDPASMQIVQGGVEEQTIQVLKNLEAVLKASTKGGKENALKCTVFLKDMGDFAKVNQIYENFFAPYKPARSAVEVARLPKDVLVEIEAIAAVSA
ncbi:YjgF-like protein [Ceraceosorus guamensis]|uniref:YjgF-like protein n=1 Tax=Ceraceosorus guamensis TaxID=1522189 RepID=A0A316VYK2_9BASI|nr:YjgF-like protein [Ceraceosorus guamensis]PWN42716.1 YjgF-like protein [Ceraceosorus guamensis]